MQAELIKNSVVDYQENNLVNACLLQFPYGRRGLKEKRILKVDGTSGEIAGT
jgi:hypothetical protein